MTKLTVAFHNFVSVPKHTHTSAVSSKENDLGANVEKTKYMFTSHEQNAGDNHTTQ